MVPPHTGRSPGGGRPGLTIQTNPTMSADNTDETDGGEEYFTVSRTRPPLRADSQTRTDARVNGCPAYTATDSAPDFTGETVDSDPLRVYAFTGVVVCSPHTVSNRTVTTVRHAYDYLAANHPERDSMGAIAVLPTYAAREVWFEVIRQFESQVEMPRDYHVCANARKVAHELGWGWRESDEPDCATVQQQSDDE